MTRFIGRMFLKTGVKWRISRKTGRPLVHGRASCQNKISQLEIKSAQGALNIPTV